MAVQIKKVPARALAISEPPPHLFGNKGNEASKCWTNKNWLKSRFHFSFAEYHNPRNTHFGVLRVMNDDLVQPLRGFGEHPHRDMEIVTYIAEGALTHQDSMGTQETLTRGSVQFMTAGRGIRHQEHNLDPENPLRFIQTWIVPRERGLKPVYGSMCGADKEQDRRNKWSHYMSDVQDSVQTPIKVQQDVNLFVAEVDAQARLQLTIQPGRQAYMLCVEGGAMLTSEQDEACVLALDRHDAAELRGPMTHPVVAGPDGAHLLYFEMAEAGGGRDDL